MAVVHYQITSSRLAGAGKAGKANYVGSDSEDVCREKWRFRAQVVY